jgi:transglutaminase-like putative cysteine protease
LKTNFRYTLDLKGEDDDPLAAFLFETREGHCEYFATAMTIMLRTLEIPARIVNGFQMGEYNELNNMYTVRESDAHSWVEVYFPRSDSWIEFDPTPAAGINDYSAGGLLARLRKYADAMEVFWLDYVVTLDSEEQASIMVDIQHRLLSFKDRLLTAYTGV